MRDAIGRGEDDRVGDALGCVRIGLVDRIPQGSRGELRRVIGAGNDQLVADDLVDRLTAAERAAAAAETGVAAVDGGDRVGGTAYGQGRVVDAGLAAAERRRAPKLLPST